MTALLKKDHCLRGLIGPSDLPGGLRWKPRRDQEVAHSQQTVR